MIMMLLTVIAAALSASLLAWLGADLALGRDRALTRRLAEAQLIGDPPSLRRGRRERQTRTAALETVLKALGRRLPVSAPSSGRLHELLTQAGYDHPSSVALLVGAQLAMALLAGALGALLARLYGASAAVILVAAFYGVGLGWLAPRLHVQLRRRRRQRELRRVLPDALDLLVVCVEAGLGLNQALLRLARDLREASPQLARELALTNLQIRAGTARETALRGLAERTGLREMRMLVTTLIQTDRFGTSISRSLRIHASSLRDERRQAVEEAAAKTAIKMVFPLVLCIFPALFVVILGPGILELIRAWMLGIG